MAFLTIIKWCLKGFYDSVSGALLIFTLDKKLHEIEKKQKPDGKKIINYFIYNLKNIFTCIEKINKF